MLLLLLTLIWMRRKDRKDKPSFALTELSTRPKAKPSQTEWGCTNGVSNSALLLAPPEIKQQNDKEPHRKHGSRQPE